MKRFITFSDIGQFRAVIRNIKQSAAYLGFDEEKQEPIMDPAPKYPIIKAQATEKIHGTNAAVCFSIPDGFWVQSRTSIIEVGKDNAACAFNTMGNEEAWKNIINNLAAVYAIDLNENIISVYFEWCGAGIQKNTAVSGIEKKMAIIFSHFKVSPIEPSEEEPAVWKETKIGETWVSDNKADIFNINEFPTYEIEIDFAQPLMIQNSLVELVENVIEPASPVGKQFGMEKNIGEGIVVTFMYKDVLHRFKVKGEKHSASPVKKLKKVDNVKLQKIQDIAQEVTPAWRLEQMFDLANDVINGNIPAMENMGTFMKMVNTDIIKEESDIIKEAGLEPKEIFRDVSTISRQFYKDRLDEIIFNQDN